MTRCVYCGRTAEALAILDQSAEILCQCCGHCYECKRLVKAHKNHTTTEYKRNKQQNPIDYFNLD